MKKVKDLIAELQKLDPELPVGKVGHYGEFYEDVDFYAREAYKHQSWDERGKPQEYMTVVDFSVHDIGPDPD